MSNDNNNSNHNFPVSNLSKTQLKFITALVGLGITDLYIPRKVLNAKALMVEWRWAPSWIVNDPTRRVSFDSMPTDIQTEFIALHGDQVKTKRILYIPELMETYLSMNDSSEASPVEQIPAGKEFTSDDAMAETRAEDILNSDAVVGSDAVTEESMNPVSSITD